MKYLSGILAFGVPCNRDSVGAWNFPKEQWLAESNWWMLESTDSPLNDFGIEDNKIVPYKEYCTYPVADHVRAYLDMLYANRFDELRGLFFQYINDAKCRSDIFLCVYMKFRRLDDYEQIHDFMSEEFGNAWISYISSVGTMSSVMQDRAQEILSETRSAENAESISADKSSDI